MAQAHAGIARDPHIRGIGPARAHALPGERQFLFVDWRRILRVRVNRVDATHARGVYLRPQPPWFGRIGASGLFDLRPSTFDIRKTRIFVGKEALAVERRVSSVESRPEYRHG